MATKKEASTITEVAPDEIFIAGHDQWEDEKEREGLTPKQKALLRPGLSTRVVMDDAGKALRDSILDQGVLEPVIAIEDDGSLFVVNGRRRTMAARAAAEIKTKAGEKGKIKIPVVVLPSDTDPAVIAAMVVTTDEIRKDDNMAIKAAKAQYLATTFGMNPKEIALKFGVSRPAVDSWLALAKASKSTMKAVESGNLTPTAAVAIVKAHEDPKEQDKALEKELKAAESKTGKRKGKVTVSAVKAKKAAKKAKDKGGKLDHHILGRFVEFCKAYKNTVAKEDLIVIEIVLGLRPSKSRKGWDEVLENITGK